MICVEIDELVPCLIDNETGEVVEVSFQNITKKQIGMLIGLTC